MNLEIEIFQYLIKNTEPRIFRKNNHRDSDKNKLRTFEPRGGENFKNIELQRKKSGSYKKKCNWPEGSYLLFFYPEQKEKYIVNFYHSS